MLVIRLPGPDQTLKDLIPLGSGQGDAVGLRRIDRILFHTLMERLIPSQAVNFPRGDSRCS